MKMKMRTSFALLWLLVVIGPLPSAASLGGDVSSVQADQAHLQATVRLQRTAQYTVHEMQAPSGQVVREYVAPTGKVFAVGWQGPAFPNLRQILGSYYEQLQVVQPNRRANRRSVVIRQPGLVFESAGHLRSFVGKAYVPNLVPEGVSAGQLK